MIGTMVPNSKGNRRERELVNNLADDDFAVLRSPASGSRTDRELPDIFAGDTDSPRIYAIEAKSSSGAPIYIDKEKVEGLQYFAAAFNATPRIAVRFDREDWYFFAPCELYRTPKGNCRIKKETAVEDGIHYTEFIVA